MSAYAENLISDDRILELDARTAAVVDAATNQLAQDQVPVFTDINSLLRKIEKLNSESRHLEAVTTIKAHLELVKNNVDNKAVFTILSTLLNVNAKQTADELHQLILEEGDKSLISNVSFIFAKYHLSRKEWNKVISILDGIFIDLPGDDSAYAYLIYGAAMQHLKQHREAVKYYEKINPKSKYYALGQLNIALAYIRQDWWTDARITITKVLQNDAAIKSDEIINRLYLVLGYSLLQKDYFRDSRDAFRHISQDSIFSNRALLGISLTAASQNDYIGSLNLLSILKNKPSLDLSVDESYLIIPYVYSNLKQYLTASASYTEALTYYQGRIDDIDMLIISNEAFSLKNMTSADGIFLIKNNVIDLTEYYPDSFFINLKIMNSLKSASLVGDIKEKQLKLDQIMQASLNAMIQNSLNERKNHLNSYLNQSRYGLARMYDTNQTSD